MIMSLHACKACYSSGGEKVNERAEAERDEGTDGKKKKARDAHVIRQGVCVWGGDYEVESGKRGIEEEGEMMPDRGVGIKIVFLSCALWKMDI